ncbi:MAG: hypothetical protein OEY14_18610, partial [Myxococcales bacterium]|nr:hypothetical protein [Myxococcales bacterium]
MNEIPIHPAIVHLPIALAMLMPLFALLIGLAVHRRKLPRWTWAFALGLQVLLVGSGMVAMQTGEHDEEIVEEIVPEQAIEAHEEAAEVFVWTGAGLVVLFALGLAL